MCLGVSDELNDKLQISPIALLYNNIYWEMSGNNGFSSTEETGLWLLAKYTASNMYALTYEILNVSLLFILYKGSSHTFATHSEQIGG